MLKRTKLPSPAPPTIERILRKCVCPQCGETLIFGRWRHYFECVGLTLGESSRRNRRKDKSEAWHLQCPRNCDHSVADILTDTENGTLYDLVTALREVG